MKLSIDDGLMGAMANQLRPFDDANSLDANLTLIYGPRRDPLYIVVPITIIYIIIFVTGVVGNISTCIVISTTKSLKTATNYYLFSLAISDFLLLISGAPQEVYSIWFKWPYVFGEVFCVARGLVAETSANATVLTITSFTVERYLAICHPFLQHTMSKLSRAIRLIVIVWIISIGLAIPQALQFGVIVDKHHITHCAPKRVIIEHSFELSTMLFFLTPMTLITILYILIGLKLRTSGIMKHEYGTTLQQRVNSACRQQTSVGTRRVLKMLVAVVLAFFLCWAPFHAQRLVAFYLNDHPLIYAIMTYISGVLYYLSTCINPLLYNLMSNKFREAFKETLAKCFKVQKRDYDSHSSYRVLSRRQRRWNCYQESGDYSGSSVRDDCLYSTSTQKQSFDSMTISQSHTSKMSIDNDLNNQYGDHNKISVMPKQKLPPTTIGNGGGKMCRFQMEMFDDIAYNDENNAKHEKSHEIHISINCTKKSTPKHDGSKLIRFFQYISRWRLHSRHIGYYSPRGTNHSIDTINMRLNPAMVVANNDGVRHITEQQQQQHHHHHQRQRYFAHINNTKQCIDDDSHSIVSNSSSKDDNEAAIKDELSAYMEELRLRELR